MHVLLAYIDPGSGSLIIQAAIATLVAVPFFFRQQIARLVGAVRGRKDEGEHAESAVASSGDVGREGR